MKRFNLTLTRSLGIAGLLLAVAATGAYAQNTNTGVKSTSGVSQTSVRVQVGSDGLTTEQRNVRDRLVEDNKPGAIKHFYVIAPRSGQVLIYSTVKGKVTSSGKRLSPRSVGVKDGKGVGSDMHGIPVKIGDYTYRTGEVIEDDGTYGSSVPYVYWWDVKGVYHQHFFTDGQIIHVSSEPIPSPNGVVIQVDDTRDDAN